MNIVVLIKLIPDLIEELSIHSNGVALDMDWIRLIINEFDDHALEQAILLKESYDANVTIIAPDVEGVDDVVAVAPGAAADEVVGETAGVGVAHDIEPVLPGDHHLVGLGQFREPPPDGDGGGTSHTGVDLVEYQHGRRVRAPEHALEREHHPRRFAARGDLGQWFEPFPGIGCH